MFSNKKNVKIPYLEKTWDKAFKLVGEDQSEFISDFCIFQDFDKQWHCIGIGGQGHSQDNFFHAVGSNLDEHFEYIKRVDSGRPDTEWMWAPYAIDDSKGNMYFYYCHHEKGEFQLRVLVPSDKKMENWVPFNHPDLKDGNISFIQDGDRDPCIFFDETENKYLMYYAANIVKDGHSDIFLRSSFDLIHWSDPLHVIGIPEGFTAAESPFVYRKHGLYYLFVSGFDYGRVAVYVSETPYDFGDTIKDKITEINAHCPEMIFDDGKDYMTCSAIHTRTGGTPAQHDLSGVFIQQLFWMDSK